MTRWSIAAAIGVSAGGLLFLVAPESLQGTVQRWIYFVSLSWLVAIAIMALRTTGRVSLEPLHPVDEGKWSRCSRRADEHTIALWTAKVDVSDWTGHENLADQRPVGVVAMDAIAGACPSLRYRNGTHRKSRLCRRRRHPRLKSVPLSATSKIRMARTV